MGDMWVSHDKAHAREQRTPAVEIQECGGGGHSLSSLLRRVIYIYIP